MHALSHVLNIGTFATWMSVGSFGVVGVLIPGWDDVFIPQAPAAVETVWLTPELMLGAIATAESDETPAEATGVESFAPLSPPPELPEIAQLPPLPEIPDLPPPPPRPVERASSLTPSPPPVARRSAAAVDSKTARPRSADNASGNGKPSGAATGGGSVMSDSARLAAGRMPSPSYPPYSRRNNQTGTVVVDFTVDGSGRVISASVSKSSSWPLLDGEAVSTVIGWKFPPGGVMKHRKPIVFRLN